jgi:EAL domain-containing protein (putative c-di-GMP-specific phosphodiesterase class I)
MRAEVQKRSSMLSLAKDALNNDWVVPHYQPKVNYRSGAIAGYEALLRWTHPQKGIQLPATIAAAFDDMNVAADISDRMIARVIEDVRRWRGEGIGFGHVAINAAAAEFRAAALRKACSSGFGPPPFRRPTCSWK